MVLQINFRQVPLMAFALGSGYQMMFLYATFHHGSSRPGKIEYFFIKGTENSLTGNCSEDVKFL